MPPGPTQLVIVGFLYLLPLIALILIVRRILKRSDPAAEGKAEPISRDELERRYSGGRLSRDEYLAVRGEILKEEDARELRRGRGAR